MAKKSKPKKILWIEDDKALIEVYASALKGEGKLDFEIIECGIDALDRIKKIEAGKSEKPDLVILDILLPDINGIQILYEIRRTEIIKNLPVFVLTNYTNEEVTEYMTDNLKSEKFLVKTEWPPSKLMPLIKKSLE